MCSNISMMGIPEYLYPKKIIDSEYQYVYLVLIETDIIVIHKIGITIKAGRRPMTLVMGGMQSECQQKAI